MSYFVVFVIGVTIGAVCVFAALLNLRAELRAEKRRQEADETRLEKGLRDVASTRQELDKQINELAGRAVSYEELRQENTILKRDLQNIDVSMRKLELDRELQQKRQELLDRKVTELGDRYLKENIKWIMSSVSADNFAACKKRMQDVIGRCRETGLEVPRDAESALFAELKAEFEKSVRAAFEREEQARIKAQIREEQKFEKEIEREIRQAERERAAVEAALQKALAEAKDEHSVEIERLRTRLAEAEAKAQRAVSQAQRTKSGYVYVISNIGSFGDKVFKIGMTRRLEPLDRVRELGDASVPFPFDVHMMISCDDAPALENALHRALHKLRINKMKPRKEFFRVDLDEVRRIVWENHGEVEYRVDPEALEYRQSLEMSSEDSEYIESVYDAAEAEEESTDGE